MGDVSVCHSIENRARYAVDIGAMLWRGIQRYAPLFLRDRDWERDTHAHSGVCFAEGRFR